MSLPLNEVVDVQFSKSNGGKGFTPNVPLEGIMLSNYEYSIVAGDDPVQLVVRYIPNNATERGMAWKSSDPDVITVDELGFVKPLVEGVAYVTGTSVDGGYTVRAKFNIARAPILVESVTVSPTSVTLEEGKTQRLTYTYLPANADNTDFYWISDDETVAVVSDNGLVTAIGEGETTVNVQYGVDSSIFDSCTVTVIPPVVHVTGVEFLTQSPLNVNIGSTAGTSIRISPEDATDKTVTYESSAPGVATVDTDGNVTGIVAGNATVTVKTNDGNFTDSIEVKVTDPSIAVTDVAWAPDSPTKVSIGHQVQTKIVITPDNATNKKVSYNSSNPDAVTVDTNGVIHGQSPGTSTITVTTDDGGLEASFVATCTEVAVITPDGLGGIPIGGTQQFTYTVSPSDAELTNIRYESADPAIATVDSSGVVTGVASGGCNIWIYATSNGADISAATWAQISEKVQVYPQYAEWLVGNTKQLDVEIYPSDSKSVTVTYESSNDAIISIDANGLMTAKSEGSATITANVVMNGVAASGTTSPYVSELSVTTDSLPALTVGNTQQLVVTVRPEYAKTDPDYSIQYTTTDDTVATVSNTGVITGVGSGGCRIGATVTVRNATASDSSYQSVDAA
ncbi:hypothetical protein birk_66 [Salmonella phage birk]|uniref:BIG2 domain-containing protein n=1 Tax=Salmonella phage birk TaxID=2713282 RepID=A0A6G8RB40_9CAUD|nr:major tail protein [Salmonella phage birk]QIN98640.1 hypothetical protein birk_66 [Salmonella phage birk]